jgi:hypothetical protein
MSPRSIAGWGAAAEFAALLLLFVSIFWLAGADITAPTRSKASFLLHLATVALAVAATQYLLVCVARVFRATHRLIEGLTSEAQWDDELRARYGLPQTPQVTQMSRHFDDFLGLQVIARQTEALNPLIYYPFLALLLMLLARFRIFDNWSIPAPLVVVGALSFAYLVVSAYRLRRCAERARARVLQSLEESVVCLQGGTAEAKVLVEQCKTLIGQVQNLRRGAFTPFTQQPLVRALLALLGTISGATLLQYATLVNF